MGAAPINDAVVMNLLCRRHLVRTGPYFVKFHSYTLINFSRYEKNKIPMVLHVNITQQYN